MCQKAVDVVDRHGRPVEGRDLLNSALSVLATIQCSKAAFDAPDATGRYSPAVATAAERMLEEYRRTGRQGKIGDIAVSQGILLYVRARLLDLSRGVTVPARENLPVLLRDAIGLARPFADQVLDAALVLADVLIVLVALQSQADPADSVHAERCLRHFAKTSDLAAAALGQLLAAQTTAQSSQIIQGAVADLPSIIGRQKEAVALLRRCRAWFARYPLAQALSQLSVRPIFAPFRSDPNALHGRFAHGQKARWGHAVDGKIKSRVPNPFRSRRSRGLAGRVRRLLTWLARPLRSSGTCLSPGSSA